MKTPIIIAACALGFLSLAPTADAAYRRFIVGHDSRGNPIVRVTWVADHLDHPRIYFPHRNRYPTSHRRD